MSAIQYGAQCEPGGQPIPILPGAVTSEPTHVGCPGGWHLEGLIGGWTCPCDCHRSVPASVTRGPTPATVKP